jgi:pimeloyl-ACP methyl ester carboxylesterase
MNLNSSLDTLKIDPTKPLFIVVHGYGASWLGKPWMYPMKDALLANGNNVILVDWTGGSGLPYLKVVANARSIGRGIGNMINAMVGKKKANLSKTTIVGYSLGAHVAGYAGNIAKGLKRIIGLDPDGPMFACYHSDARLDATDADYVEVLHTNGDVFSMGGCGTLQPMGTVDFYANGGWLQPGCSRGLPQVITDVLSLDFSIMLDDYSCNHARAFQLFIESVKNAGQPDKTCQFVSFPCDTSDKYDAGECFKCKNGVCPRAGYLTDADTAVDGKYFFKTNAINTNGEYCGNQYVVSITSTVDVKGSISITLYNEQNIAGTVEIQGIYDTLSANTPKKLVIVTPWEIQKITRMTLMYNRYYSSILMFLNAGTKQWTLTTATITDTNLYTVTSKKDIQIYDAVLADISFSH